MNNFNKNIIEKIEKGEIKQESKWLYLIENFSLWLSFILTTIFSTLAFNYFLKDITDKFGKMHEIKVQSSLILNNLFLIWGITFIIFIFISLWTFKKTKNGFKYENYKIILSSLLISIILGSTLYFYQIKKKTEHNFQKYHKVYIDNNVKK